MVWREILILLREFRRPVLTFAIAIIGLGILYLSIAQQAGEPLSSLPEAIYLVLTLALFCSLAGIFHTTISFRSFTSCCRSLV
jgi:hypothetical protein